MIHCIVYEASMRAKYFCVLTTTESTWRIVGTCKMLLSSTPVPKASIHSKAVILLLFIHCLFFTPIVYEGSVFGPFFAKQYLVPSFMIILIGKRELVALL